MNCGIFFGESKWESEKAINQANQSINFDRFDFSNSNNNKKHSWMFDNVENCCQLCLNFVQNQLFNQTRISFLSGIIIFVN